MEWLPRAMSLALIMAICYSVSILFMRFFLKDEYVDYKTYIDALDYIGDVDFYRDCVWILSTIIGLALNVTLYQVIPNPLWYLVGFALVSILNGSLHKPRQGDMWKTKDDNVFLEDLFFTGSIFYAIVAYLIYLATL